MSLALDSARRRAPDERPQQILDAALTEFGERGLVGARLEDIAARAGVAKGTIYLYFPNKEALFQEMIRRTVVARMHGQALAIAASSPDESAAAQLTACMTQWWNALTTEPFRTIYRLVLSELPRFPDLLAFYAREVVAPGTRLIGGVIARGVARGEFRPVDPYTTARLLKSLFVTHALWIGPQQHAFPTLCDLTPDQVFAQLRDFAFAALRPVGPGAAGSALVPNA